MSDPQEAATPHENVVFDRLMQSKREFTAPLVSATPSDPHSAEALAEYPDHLNERELIEGGTTAYRRIERVAFDAGRVSRDAEVAELKAKIADAVARLNAASIPPMMTEAQFNATTITDARRILLGSASSPVEGGN